MVSKSPQKKDDRLLVELKWAKTRLQTVLAKVRACKDRLRLAKQRQKLAKKAARFAKGQLKEAKHELKRAKSALANLATQITLAKGTSRKAPRPTR